MATNMNLKSGVWAHFIRNPVSQTAECKLCKARLKKHWWLERAVSAAGSIRTKIVLVFVNTLDNLLFLRTFYRGRKSSSQ